MHCGSVRLLSGAADTKTPSAGVLCDGFVTMSMVLTMRRAVTLLTIPNILTSSRAVLAVWFALAAPHVSSAVVLPVLLYGFHRSC